MWLSPISFFCAVPVWEGKHTQIKHKRLCCFTYVEQEKRKKAQQRKKEKSWRRMNKFIAEFEEKLKLSSKCNAYLMGIFHWWGWQVPLHHHGKCGCCYLQAHLLCCLDQNHLNFSFFSLLVFWVWYKFLLIWGLIPEFLQRGPSLGFCQRRGLGTSGLHGVHWDPADVHLKWRKKIALSVTESEATVTATGDVVTATDVQSESLPGVQGTFVPESQETGEKEGK